MYLHPLLLSLTNMRRIFRYLKKDYIPWQFWLWLALAAILSLISGILVNSEVGALVFTAIFIAWYSVETRNLVMEMKITNVLAVQPIIVLDYNREGEWMLHLQNIGKGAAIKLEVHPQNQDYRLEIDKHTLAPGEAIPMKISKQEHGEWASINNYHEEFQSNPLQIKIIFHNTLKTSPLYSDAVVHNPPKIEMNI